MIVADASLITCFAVQSEWSQLADGVCEADATWAAPLLWRSEVRDVLVKYMQVAGMTLDAALLAMHSADEIINGREYAVDTGKVLELATASGCTARECEYVALALDLDVPLVTMEKQVLRAFPKVAVAVDRFAKAK